MKNLYDELLAARGAQGGMLKRCFDAIAGGRRAACCPHRCGWLIAAAIKLEDGGPIFYRQERVGLGGRPFDALKFRSMRPDAESMTGAMQASAHDPRVTRIGRLMRATAMDELPQLWNILRGDMSFVGPRALRPGEIEASGDGTLHAARRRAGIRTSHHGAAGAHRARADLRATRRAAATEVPLRPRLRESSLAGARSAFDSRLVLD